MLATKKYVKNEVARLDDARHNESKHVWEVIRNTATLVNQLAAHLGYEIKYPQSLPRISKKGKK